MVTIYAPNAQDFSTLGLGALAPYECTVEEQAGGMYELTMSHPMDEAGKWLNIGIGCILKAPAPVRETPLAVEGDEGVIPTEPETVTRRIYRVRTNTGANLHLRQGPSTSTRILSKYRPGTEVVVLSQSGGWGQVIVCSSGASGYMSMQYLVYVRDEVETIEGDVPSPERVVYPVQSRMQLFRIVSVERDAAEREVRVTARHIFYDLLGNVVKNEYAPEGAAANAVVGQLFERALNPHDFDVHCQSTKAVTGEYTRRGIVECLLDPDDGVVAQAGARLIRDNFDIWILPDAARETGVTIRHGKNLLGATLTTDMDSVVTRIIPVGQDSEGKPLLLSGTIYVDSPHIGDYPTICAQAIEYDVKVGQDGINNAAQARAKLTELAQADFNDNGVDLPTVGLDVDFVALGETEEYRQYADLQAVHLYDTVRVIAKSAGIDAAVRVTGYKWDALGRKYEAVTLGEIADLKTTVYGYELQRGSVKTIKIAPGAVGSAQLRELAVQYAHINTAAVEQLSANSITALKAYIHELVAGSITTDQLYADLAAIALAQITTANIENANIDWAQIGTLSADIATIAKAHLGDADINWANIANLTAAVAEIAQVEIGEAVIDGAQITDGTITNAKIENGAIDTAKIALGAITTALIATGAVGTAQIADGSITDAKIVSLNADVINAGTLSVDRLLLKGPDGLFVAINATDEGLTSEQLSQEEYQSAISGSVLVARSVTADKIAAKSITANEIAAGAITTAELAAESVDASKIKAGSITTSHVAANFGETLDISSNKQVEIIAGNVQQAQETADSAQEAAEQAAPYISATPPEGAPEAGKLWLDEGVEPSMLRKWRGADVTTEREYTEMASGAALLTLDNGAGQIKSVAVEAGCRAKQAGTGDPSPENIRAITGRESVEIAACGKNLVDLSSLHITATNVQMDMSDDSVHVYTTDEGGKWRGINTPDFTIFAGVTYTLSATLSSYVSGYARVGLRGADNNTFVSGATLPFNATTGKLSATYTPDADDEVYLSILCTSDTVLTGDCTFSDIQLEVSSAATAYEPYRSMGGGTATPAFPLYGLPGAEDTVEASVDGDVTVTRRTAVLELDGTESWTKAVFNTTWVFQHMNLTPVAKGAPASAVANALCSHYDVKAGRSTSSGEQGISVSHGNYIEVCDMNYLEPDDFKSYLAAQAAAGTPVTIVYELAAPETEALTAVTAITPAKGPVSIITDADALSASIVGSGWETVNDTTDVRMALTGVDTDLAALAAELGLLDGQVGQIAEQIITPDEIKNIVVEMDEYKAMATTVSQTASDLEFARTQIAEVDGRVLTIEEYVRISGSNVDIGRSDSKMQLHLDNEGWDILEDGRANISARDNKVSAPRMDVSEALMMGGMVFRSGGGHLRLQKR